MHLPPFRLSLLLAAVLVLPAGGAQPPLRKSPAGALGSFSDSMQDLVARVSPSVVQIVVTRYAPVDDSSSTRTGLAAAKEQGVGSGVIFDPGGYIVTNAHVVAGALRIRVLLPPSAAQQASGEALDSALAQSSSAPLDATLIGTFKEADLAVLKIQARGLPALPFADYKNLRAGQVVLVFGSRAGLQNSVSMGLVSSVARQPSPDSPFVYIQTDAAINPGDSGGPLVNTAGEVVGLATFILSQSGGSEGMGFAIPSPLVEIVSRQLKDQGRFQRQVTGIGVQTITPALAGALNLSRSSGVLVSDVHEGSPAEAAGLQLNDIILSLDGNEVRNLPMFMMSFLAHPASQPIRIAGLRGSQPFTLDVTPVAQPQPSSPLAACQDPAACLIPRLGMAGLAITPENESSFAYLRHRFGVVLAARSSAPGPSAPGLQLGDVVQEINGTLITSIARARQALDAVQPGDPVALLIERDGQRFYVAFETE